MARHHPECDRGELTFRHITDLVDDIVEVTEDEIAGAWRLTVSRTKLAVEPSAAAPIAALLTGKIDTRRDTGTVTVASGGKTHLF